MLSLALHAIAIVGFNTGYGLLQEKIVKTTYGEYILGRLLDCLPWKRRIVR